MNVNYILEEKKSGWHLVYWEAKRLIEVMIENNLYSLDEVREFYVKDGKAKETITEIKAKISIEIEAPESFKTAKRFTEVKE